MPNICCAAVGICVPPACVDVTGRQQESGGRREHRVTSSTQNVALIIEYSKILYLSYRVLSQHPNEKQTVEISKRS